MSHTIRATFDAGATLPSEQWRLHVITSPDVSAAGRVIGLSGGGITLGRSAGAGLNCVAVEDQRLSRRHASLRVDPQTDELEVEDLQSSNGTWIRGKRVIKQTLNHGSVLRIGNTVAVVERDGGTSADFLGSIAAIPGHSEVARRLRESVTSNARGFAPVLVIGPAGSGKGKIAREIHRQSRRVGNKVAVRMEQFASAEAFDVLFGGRDQEGLLEKARGGTLILEQVDLTPESLQIALRRLLLDPEQLDEYDARIVALSSNSLLDAVENNGYDLRLAEFLTDRAIEVPPLSVRQADLVSIGDAIAPLTDSRYASTWSGALDADAAEMLLHYGWPTNLSELKKVLLPLVHTIGVEGCGVEDLPAEIIRSVKNNLHGKPSGKRSNSGMRERPSYTAVQLCHLLAVHGGVTPMAAALGCSRDELIAMFRGV